MSEKETLRDRTEALFSLIMPIGRDHATEAHAILDAIDQLRTERDALARKVDRLDNWLHSEGWHPDYEYATTSGPRKAWGDEDVPPTGGGWERNTNAGSEGWERFAYHEESYWRRPKPPQGGEMGNG